MPTYVEHIKPAGGETYQIRDPEAARQTDLNETNQKLEDKVDTTKLFNMIYPIGSIYLSTVNINPGELFGGTWEQIKDRFLLSAGDTYDAGSTGGASQVTLTVDQMPSHTVSIPFAYGVDWIDSLNGGAWTANSNTHPSFINYKITSEPVGGSQPHNNMPPYLAVYIWKRTS